MATKAIGIGRKGMEGGEERGKEGMGKEGRGGKRKAKETAYGKE